MKALTVCCLIAALAASGCGTAGERYQRAEIHVVRGELCFSIDPSASRNQAATLLSNVRVDQRIDGIARNIWEADFLEREPPYDLEAGECIPYSNGVPDPAPALGPGEAYSVTILADVKANGRYTARWYTAHFCIVESVQGLVPHQVESGGRSDASGWAECVPSVRW